MTSSSSLYGTVTTQSTSSGNSTSLYGEAGTPIPDAGGNVVVRGDLIVLSGNILTTATTGNIFPTNATTINLGLAATTVSIGAGSGTTTINNDLDVSGDITADGADFGNITIAVADNNTITTTSGGLKLSSTTGEVGLVGADTLYTDQSTFFLLNSPTTVTAFDSATSLTIGDTTGTTTIRNALTVLDDITAPGADLGNITVGITDNQTITTTTGELRLGSTTSGIKLTGIDTLYTDTTGTFNLLNAPTTVNAFQSATTLTIGETTGTTTIRNDLTVQGDITATGADFGNITIAVADDQTITTTSGELRLSSTSGNIKLASVNTMYTDETTFNLLNSPTTVTAFANAAALTLGDTTGTTTIRNDAVVTGDLTVTGNDIKSAGGTTAITLSGNDVSIADDLTVNGNNLNLAQATTIAYSENNDRTNRPQVQSTTGNISGFRVLAPNGTTSASSNLTVFGSNDIDNGEFLSVQATGSTTAPFNIRTGKYTAGVLGASNEEINFIDNVTTYASINPAGPTNPTDLTTKAYVDALPANITYTIDSSSTTGGANFNLVGSDSTTDTIKLSGGTNVTVTATSANEITISAPDTNTTYTQNASSTTGGANLNLVGSDSTTDTVKFAGGTNVTVVATDANTITINAPDTNTTYTQNISATTGGANLNLVGSDSTTDTVKFADGTGVTVSYTDASTATIAIGQAVGTSDNVQFNGVTTNSITTGTVNANGGVSFVNTAPMGGTYATVNQLGPVNSTDLTTVDYVNSILPTVVTYDFAAASTTGGANLNLTGSNSTTDTVKLTNGGHITATYTSATEVTLGSDATSANTAGAIVARDGSGNFSASGATLGNITVGVADDQTIATTSGNLVLDSASGTLVFADAALSSSVAQTWTVVDNNASALSIGATGKADILKIVSTDSAEGVTMSGTLGVTGIATVGDDSRTLGEHVASRSTSWLPPASTLTTTSGTNGFAVGSSTGYTPNIQSIYYSGDTTSGTNSAAAFTIRGATGTNTSPTAATTNQVLGTYNWDGYGTTNWANSLATTNAGAGTATLFPLQVQGYARQAFADSAAVSTTVTGASGTGTVATLTFTTQNTAPYAVGQTVAIAGMTPSGYNNAAAVITAATTSSISYANTTTGFTSGGTITAARTVTQAGMGFRVRGYASSTNMTTANRFNFMDLTASAATFKSNAYTFANEVITGSTLTATNYLTLASTGHTIGNVDGIVSLVRASGGTAGSRPVQTVRNTQTATAAPSTGDGATYRLQTAGSNGTVYTLAEVATEYSTTGDTLFAFNLANGDQTGAVSSFVRPLESKLSQTVIAATASPTATAGGNTLTTVAIFDATKISASVPVKFPTYTAAAANAITGAVGWQISISNSPTVGGRMAFWDTTNARWSYISDNTAV